MMSLLIVLYAWAIGLLMVAVFLIVCAIKFLRYSRKVKTDAETAAAIITARAKHEHSKIAEMSITDINKWLNDMYAEALFLAVHAHISDKDPGANEKLLANSVQILLGYISDELISAINFYCGEDYIVTWCSYRYDTLVMAGVIPLIINKSITIDAIRKIS